MPLSIDNIFGESTPTGKSTTPVSSSKVSLDNIFASAPVGPMSKPGVTPVQSFPVTLQSAIQSVKAPKVTIAPKTPLIKDNSTLGIIKNTITGIPKAAWNFLGIGKVQDYLNTPEGQDAAANLTFGDVAKSIVPAVGQFFGQPVADVAGVFTGPKTYKVPVIGGVTNIQKQTYDAVQAGENPYVAIVNAVPQSIFDGLMVAGITEKIFSPRENVIATGVKSNDLPSGTKPIQGDRSFRLSKAPEIKSNPVPNEALTKLQESGVKLKNYNPANPTYFRTTQMGNGVIKGEIVQLKPSYFNLFKSKFGGDINSVPEEGTNTVYENTTTINELQNKMGEQTAPKTEAVTPTPENLTDLATTIKEGKPIETGPTIKLPKTAIESIASQFKPKLPEVVKGVPGSLTPYDTPEIVAMRAKAEAIPKTHLINTPEREALRKSIVDETYGTGALKKEKRVDIVTGGPATGKSSKVGDFLVKEHGSLLADSDIVKPKLSEFGEGEGAMAVHRESAKINMGVMVKAIKNGDNIVWPHVGETDVNLKKMIDIFHNAGYEIHLHHVELPLEKSMPRLVERGIKTKRFVDTNYAYNEVGLRPNEVNAIIKTHGKLTSQTRYSSDTERGAPAKLLEESGNLKRRGRVPTQLEGLDRQGGEQQSREIGRIDNGRGVQSNERVSLPEVSTNLKRITDYQDRLKLRGADPVLVDAIITPLGGRAFGVSVGGTLSFEKVVEQFTEDHEIFHQVMQNMEKMRIFDKFDKTELFNEAKNLYGPDKTDLQLEEELAKDYQQYVHDREANRPSTFFDKIKEFFDRLYAAMKRMFRTQRDINEFFRTIYEEKGTNEVTIKNEMPESFKAQQKAGIVDFRMKAWDDIKYNLKESTGLTAKDIIAKHPDIELKRDIIITDVYGEKATLKQGEGITPYEMTGNKFILQDGEAYLVSKSQAQNVINNSITSVSKEFAPELKQTEETIKGDVLAKTFDDINWKDVSRPGEGKVLNGTLGDRQFIIQQEKDGYYVAEKDGLLGRQAKNYTDAVETLNRYLKEQAPKTKYSQYTLPGGTNYKEILIKAPEDKFKTSNEYNDYVKNLREKYGGRLDWEKMTAEEIQKHDLLSKTNTPAKEGFTGAHWSEPNVISHIRMNERTYDGKKVAFMEELQSDWAREARKTPEKLPTGTTEEMQAEFGSTKTPTHPLLKNWQELSIKRALQEAVNSNAKYFAWINGPQTAARYNLSKEVSSINWSFTKAPDEKFSTREVIITPKGSQNLIKISVDTDGVIQSTNNGSDWDGKKLDEVIGKGVAEKIMASEDGKLEGEGLNFGGEWATTLYDKQVPNIIKNLTGAEVKTLDMGLSMSKDTNEWKSIDNGGYISPNLLKSSGLKVGLEISNGREGQFGANNWIITDVLGDGKFKAIKTGEYGGIYLRDGESFMKLKKEKPSDFKYIMKEFHQESFDISTPKTVQQMGIELTPEVKAIINGEARQIAKPSGVLPFEKQVTAPPMFNIKLPKVNTGNKLEDAKQILAHVEKTLGVSSAVKSIKDQEALIEIGKEVLDMSPMKDLEPYVANGGTYKGNLPEVTGKSIEEIKKSGDFKRNTNPKAILFAKEGDSIAKSVTSNYGSSENEMTSEEARAAFEDYQGQKEKLVTQEKALKKQKLEFGKTDTFELVGKDKTLIGEITATKEMPVAIKEIMDQVMKEKKARREEVLNHPARPLMKYVNKKDSRLPEIGTKTAFGEKGDQILGDLGFKNIDEANKAIDDYISKRNEFVNPTSRLALDERNARFLRDKQKIMDEVEKKIRAEGRDRKAVINSIRDFFYMTDSEIKDVIGAVDYRLISDNEFKDLTDKIREESLKIAEHQVAVSEVEWTIAQKELQKTDNFLQAMELPTNLKDLTTEQLNKLNELFNMFENQDIFLGKREIQTLAKNTKLSDVKTYRQIVDAIFPGADTEALKSIRADWTSYVESASSLSQDNPLFNWLITEFREMSIEKNQNIQMVKDELNQLAKEARQSRKRSLIQKLIPTDDLVWDYINEGDLEIKQKIAATMTPQELKFAHYMAIGPHGWSMMRDYLLEKEALEHYFKNETYITHIRRGFLEAWLNSEQKNNVFSIIPKFIRAVSETIFKSYKLDERTLNILNERTGQVLPLEKHFKFKEHRTGILVPTKNMSRVFIEYYKTFETKRMLDQFMPVAVSLAHAVAPTERTEGGLEMDTSISEFFREFINTQKGRPMSFGKILSPGNSIDVALRLGIAVVRYKYLAYNFISQATSPIGEQYATYIQLGNKKYAKGVFRSKITKQGDKIAHKYESVIGETLFKKLADESKELGSKIGETAFLGFSVAGRQANKVFVLGSLTPEEFKTGEISTERLAQIENDMYKWRAGDPLSGIAAKTSVGATTRQFRSWAIPIASQSLRNVNKMIEISKKKGFKSAFKSKEFGELFRATIPLIIFMLTMYHIYNSLQKKQNKTFLEQITWKAMSEVTSSLSALSPAIFLSAFPLQKWLLDLSTSLINIGVGLVTNTRTATGEVPGTTLLKSTITPSLFKSVLNPSQEDLIMTSITTSTVAAQKKVDAIDSKIVDAAKAVWEGVKKAGVGTEEADAIVEKLSDDEYTAYKSVKAADVSYWTELATKVTPIVEQAYKLEFGSPEADKLIEGLTDDEYKSYQLVKKNLYGTGEAIAQPTDWDKQTFIQHISNLAKGWSTDPATAFDNLIHGDWKITQIKGGAIIVSRMPLSASEEVKTKAAKNNADYKLDHVVSLEMSGTNRPSNLNIITTEQWKENTPVENYLGKALKENKVTSKEARELIIRYKVGSGQVLSDELMKEYQTKYASQPITFDEIKQEVVQ